MVSRKFPGYYKSLAEIGEFIRIGAEQAGLDENAIYAVQLAVDEACSNIIEHAYGGEGEGEIECRYSSSESGLEIILRDSGKPFSPEKVKAFETDLPLRELGNRGAGVFLMRKLMDEVEFRFSKSGGTELKMKKNKP